MTEEYGFESRQAQELILFSTVSTPVLGLTQPRIQWVPGALCLDSKQLGPKTGHSPQYMADDTSTPPYTVMACYMVKHKGKFTVTFSVVGK
jgi:hypothetical protein